MPEPADICVQNRGEKEEEKWKSRLNGYSRIVENVEEVSDLGSFSETSCGWHLFHTRRVEGWAF